MFSIALNVSIFSHDRKNGKFIKMVVLIKLDIFIMVEINMKPDRNQSATISSKLQVTALKMIRERERLCHMLGIEYKSPIRYGKYTNNTIMLPLKISYHQNSKIERRDISDIVDKVEAATKKDKASIIRMALEFIISEMEQGREPTPEQVAQYVGMKSRPLGTQLSKVGIKSMATRREGQGMRIYPISMKPKIEELLKC
jgi:type I site-specific restriction-modification system R (restriction) subunit